MSLITRILFLIIFVLSFSATAGVYHCQAIPPSGASKNFVLLTNSVNFKAVILEENQILNGSKFKRKWDVAFSEAEQVHQDPYLKIIGKDTSKNTPNWKSSDLKNTCYYSKKPTLIFWLKKDEEGFYRGYGLQAVQNRLRNPNIPARDCGHYRGNIKKRLELNCRSFQDFNSLP